MENFKKITSKDNSLIKLVCALQSSRKARLEHNLFVLEGVRICDDACSCEIRFDKLIISETAFSKYESAVKSFEKNSNECYLLPDSLFKKISDTTSPQGIIALASMPKMNNTINKNGRYIALENLADPSNLGAISRTAEALGVSGIILSSDSCDPYSPKSIRASMGTLFRMPLIIFDDFSKAISESGLKSFACVVDKNAKSITEVSFENGSVVIIGNEANGLTEKTKQTANEQITIKMSGKAESLNAATAAAISIWEMMK
ncbi:MAG: RNA methyltransferase [Ruminococcaceae bacterium]|nr:RNA methyltransferase [Oscillospiraceae bacterium]